MSIYQRVKEELLTNKKLKEEGKHIAIPWPNLPKLSTVLPGIQRGRYYICSANSKVGKTQLCDYLFLYEPLEFIYKNPNSDIKLKIFYFSLEMGKEDKILQMISNKIYRDNGRSISTDDLRSYFAGYTLTDELANIIATYEPYFNWVESHVEFVDNVRNPYGLYKTVRDFARANGKFYDKNNVEVHIENGDTLYEHYTPNDPDLRVIVITDHLSLLQPEKGQELWDAMFNYSSNYCLKMRDNFNYTIVNVQQQAADQEKQQFTFKGDSIVEKLRPSADGLADCKLTGRDADCMISLFAPNRYKIPTYPVKNGYDITKLADNYREFSIVFNRRGGGSINLDLYFDGKCNYFSELPPVGSELLQILYNSL